MPAPTGRWSTSTTGLTWAPVPQRMTSSATYSSVRSIERILRRDPGVGRELDDGGPRDALEDVVGHRWGDEDAVANHEQVLGRTLRDVAVGGEDDRLVEAVELASVFWKARFT